MFYRNDRGYLVTGLLIARSKFLQRNVYASMLKEKDTCQIKTDERSQSLFVVAFFVKNLYPVYTRIRDKKRRDKKFLYFFRIGYY